MCSLDFGQTLGIAVSGPTPGVTLSRHEPGEELPLHEHAGGYVCIVLKGRFREKTAHEDNSHSAGQVIVHPPEDCHADIFGPEGALCLNLHFDGMRATRSVMLLSPELASAAGELAAETAKGPLGDALTVEALTREILVGLDDGRAPTRCATAVNTVIEALESCPEGDWCLGQLAQLAGRHPTHLARLFREKTGLSIGAYRRRARFARLCLALRLDDLSLAELAQAHGFADQAHMSREFRVFAGISPNAYRRCCR